MRGRATLIAVQLRVPVGLLVELRRDDLGRVEEREVCAGGLREERYEQAHREDAPQHQVAAAATQELPPRRYLHVLVVIVVGGAGLQRLPLRHLHFGVGGSTGPPPLRSEPAR